MMDAPPDYVIEAAREAATRSPCEKSKRGVVAMLLQPHRPIIAARGWNSQPGAFACDGSDACRAACGMRCVHAEQRAILSLRLSWPNREPDCELVHVKVVDGQVVPGKGPCCAECSKLVLEVGLRGVWLLEYAREDALGRPQGDWRFYSAEDFHRETLRAIAREPSVAALRIRERRVQDESTRLKTLLAASLKVADALVLELAGSGATARKLDQLDMLHAIREAAGKLGVE